LKGFKEKDHTLCITSKTELHRNPEQDARKKGLIGRGLGAGNRGRSLRYWILPQKRKILLEVPPPRKLSELTKRMTEGREVRWEGARKGVGQTNTTRDKGGGSRGRRRATWFNKAIQGGEI